jgi:cytochrome c oxidase subunit 2
MADVTVPAPGAGEPTAPDAAASQYGPGSARKHWRVMIVIWFVLSAVIDPIYWYQAGPHIPPGTMTDTATGQQFDFNVLLIMAIPVILAVWVYMGYAIWKWRASRGGPEPVAGPHSRSHLGLQVGWMSVTSAIVLGLFVFGTYELVVPAGAGGGQGPNPVWTPSTHKVLPVQVIAQQWLFTYRYPTFGAFETQQLVLPANTTIAFHVTSLDVIHSFWAYQLGVKADANPAQDNVAFSKTRDQLGGFTVRCSELCGLWHGSMFSTRGRVESQADFLAWAKATETAQAAATKLLPPFSYTYVPDANSADGALYPDDRDPYSNVEMYGAQKATP